MILLPQQLLVYMRIMTGTCTDSLSRTNIYPSMQCMEGRETPWTGQQSTAGTTNSLQFSNIMETNVKTHFPLPLMWQLSHCESQSVTPWKSHSHSLQVSCAPWMLDVQHTSHNCVDKTGKIKTVHVYLTVDDIMNSVWLNLKAFIHCTACGFFSLLNQTWAEYQAALCVCYYIWCLHVWQNAEKVITVHQHLFNRHLL